ncbi:hypothetical protein [Microbacterium sp. USHLN272]|uniref:hypothetical protein n=1 Tax=Microbacterium sp. USHLN272 TaxID=3081287 RepID=UPI0030164D1D
MTSTQMVSDALARRTLLEDGAGSNQAAPPRNRLEDGFEEYAAEFLQAHPEISAAVPFWTEEIDFSTIECDVEDTIFSFSAEVGVVELYGCGKLLQTGEVRIDDAGAPNVYLPAENDFNTADDAVRWMLDVAQNLITAAGLLRAEPKLLRRPAGVDEQLRELDA